MRFYFLLFLVFSLVSPAQQKKQEINDFVVSLHEEAINKVLTAIGDISGSNTYEIMFISAPYKWTVKNPKINIRPDSSDFTCDALVNAGPISYKTKVIGNVKITYDNLTNLINIKISRAIFELYTIVFGKKVHIKDIHLEDYFKEPFVFEGPRSMSTEMAISLPDSTTKKIYVQPTECRMELKWKEICTACEVAA
ncbi:MAG: hypothetical protein ACXVNM_11360, partial [Bacteroidia bacterium]